MKQLSFAVLILLLFALGCSKESNKPDFIEKIDNYWKKNVKKKLRGKAKEDGITYPFVVNSMQNLLTDTVFNYQNSIRFMIAAHVPKGKSLKIICAGSAGGDVQGGGNWIMENQGWTITNNNPVSFIYEVSGEDKTVNIPFMCTAKKTIEFNIFENGSSMPTRVRSVTFQ